MSELDISTATDTSLITSVEAASNLVREQLTEVALSPEYDEITGLAFGNNYNQQVADSIWSIFAQGDLSELPNIQVISSDILGNANGAYGKEVDTIFLSDDFVRNHNTQEIAGVLTEEIGHYIDSRINTVDAAGDEGDIFSRLVRGESLSGAELALLKEEDDSAVISINGQEVAIEKNDTLSTAYNIGTLSGSRSFSDWVGSADTNDYYRFYVDSQSNFSLGLTGLTADADVQLLNSAGSLITSSSLSGSSSESINTQLSTGTYYVRVFPFNGANTNYNLSLNATPVAPPDYAGNSTSAARDIGTLNSSRSFSDWVGSADTNDYYRFYVDSQSNFSLGLTGLTADADVQLLNSSGSVITSSILGGSSSESINTQLSTGTYYVRVFPFSGSTNYNLSLNATPVAPPDYAGNSTSAARDIGTLNSSRSFSDWVGSADTNDYYRFSVGSQSNFSLGLTGLTADADVQLLNSFGTVITSSTLGGSSSESINTQLSTGTYYVRVYPYGSANTNYNLSLNATTVVPPDYAGNTLGTARNDIGTLSGSRSFTDWVGTADTNDYYRFSIGTQSNFSLSLNGLSGDADVQLLDVNGNLIQSSTNIGTTADTISRTLNAGTYFARIYPMTGVNTNYNLSLNATPVPTPTTDPGNTLGTATVQSSAIFSRNEQVSSSDTNDFYRFNVGTSGIFTANLTGLTGDADVRLIRDGNNNGQIDQGEVVAWQWERQTRNESIRSFLNSGTYFLQVMNYNNQTANYNIATNFTAAASDNRQFSIGINWGQGADALSSTMRNAVQEAAQFWQNVITHSSFNGNHNVTITVGGRNQFWSNGGGVLASAGATGGSIDANGNWMPTTGVSDINNNPAAVSSLSSDINYFRRVMIHEFGHVLGLVGLQNNFVNRSTGMYSANSYAGWAYGELLRTYQQTAIPMTTGVGPGSDYSHWQESVFRDEVMTHAASGNMALSQMTIAALRDLGWNVNYGAAESYSV